MGEKMNKPDVFTWRNGATFAGAAIMSWINRENTDNPYMKK